MCVLMVMVATLISFSPCLEQIFLLEFNPLSLLATQMQKYLRCFWFPAKIMVYGAQAINV